MGPSAQPSKATNATATSPPAPRPSATAGAEDADTSMADVSSASLDAKKRKRKAKETHILHQTTFRRPTWSYLHLTLVTPGTVTKNASSKTFSDARSDIDALTVLSLLSQPLTAYLGTTGAAIPIDILHTKGRSAWVRIPRPDARAFQAALSGWVGGCDAGSLPDGGAGGGRVEVAWRVGQEGGSLGLLGGTGEELFGETSGVAY